MRKFLRTVVSIVVATGVTISALWGAVEAFTYFGGDWLKNLLGPYWIIIFVVIPIAYSLFFVYSENRLPQLKSFEVINRDFLKRFNNNNDSKFYMGTHPKWIDIVGELDVRREIMPEVIDDIKNWKDGALLIPVLANAGEGKSSFLMRLAVELNLLGYTVLFHKRSVANLDISDVTQVTERNKLPVCILVDDATYALNLKEFITDLVEVNKSCIIIAASRPYEWQPLKTMYQNKVKVALDRENKEYSLNNVSDVEIEALFIKLRDAKIIRKFVNNLKVIVDKFSNSPNRSLLVVSLFLTQEKSLTEFARGELDFVRSLGGNIFKSYIYTCLMGSVNSFLTVDMLKLLVGFQNVKTEFINLLPGLVEVVDKRVFARHNRIAEATCDIMFNNADDERGQTLYDLICAASQINEYDVLKALSLRYVPSSQLEKVAKCLFDYSYSKGYYDLLKWHFGSEYERKDGLIKVLVQRTPTIIKDIILEEGLSFKFDFDDYSKEINYPFEAPQLPKPEMGNKLDFDSKLDWLDVYRLEATWGEHPREISQLLYHAAFQAALILSIEYTDQVHKLAFLAGKIISDSEGEKWASPFYQAAIEEKQDFVDGYVMLAGSLYYEGRKREACEAAKIAMDMDRSRICYHDKEYVFKELLIICGELEYALKLGFYVGQYAEIGMANIQSSIRQWLVSSAIREFNGEISSDEKRLDESDESDKEMDTALLRKEFQEIEEVCRKLSFDEKIQMGKQVFGMQFGELCEQNGEVARAEFDSKNDEIEE
jgi:hypothetical protein